MNLKNKLWISSIICIFINYNIRLSDPVYFLGHFQWIQSQKIYLWQVIIPLTLAISLILSKQKLKFYKNDYALILLVCLLHINFLLKLGLISLIFLLKLIPKQIIKKGLKISLYTLTIIALGQIMMQQHLNLTWLGEIQFGNHANFNLFNFIRPYGLSDHPNLFALQILIISLYLDSKKLIPLILTLSVSLQNIIAYSFYNHKRVKIILCMLIVGFSLKNPWIHPKSYTDRILQNLPNQSQNIKLKPWEHIPKHHIYGYLYDKKNFLALASLLIWISLIYKQNKKTAGLILILSLLDHQLLSQTQGLNAIILSNHFVNIRCKKLKQS